MIQETILMEFDMSDTQVLSSFEIGRYLAVMRERANITQTDLASRVTMSKPVLSRIEAGERALAPDELQSLLNAIGTPEAIKLLELMQRQWLVLPRPPLDHRDQDLLWKAECVAQALVEFRSRPNISSSFDKRLTEYLNELEHFVQLILKREHAIACIGAIGVGKSTAICAATGLEVPNEKGGAPLSVLESGSGGTTICEVHVSTGPEHALTIDPLTDDEIRTDVAYFAEYVFNIDAKSTDEIALVDKDSPGLTREINNAIRNMSGLMSTREKTPEGKLILVDRAKELAKQFSSTREFVVEVLARMELHRRDRRSIRYDPSSGKLPLIWLKETFKLVNRGLHPEFTLPKRIDIVVPQSLLDTTDPVVHIIDTKGIDKSSPRADIEEHFYDPHTLTVLCSTFNDAPSAEPRQLLERAKEVDAPNVENGTMLLVLPKNSEALDTKDGSGGGVESIEEGYMLKGHDVEVALEQLGLSKLPVEFFDARRDDPARLRKFLLERIEGIRQNFREQLQTVSENAGQLLANHEELQVQLVIDSAGTSLRTWVEQHAKLPSTSLRVEKTLLTHILAAHPATIRATVLREGEWPNLSYSHHLGHGARRLAVRSLSSVVDSFTDFCNVIRETHKEAAELISQAERVMRSAYDDLLRKMQLMGQTAFKGALKLDADFWKRCTAEFGSGYRNRIAEHNEEWFDSESAREIEAELLNLLNREWAQTLQRVNALVGKEG
ncbi:transcriptional regulator [Herbaspirillum sp. HC18]|nr:transcriptional regulator [Herbaspirillum sp. HC18]